MRQLLLFPHLPPADAGPAGLAPRERDGLLAGLLRGGSPHAVCRSLGLDLAVFQEAAETDSEFRRRLCRVREALTQNVAARVYKAALEGTPAAQALWLRTFPPPSYADSADPRFPAETSDAYASLPTDAIDLQLSAYRAAAGFGAGERDPGGFGPDGPEA